jgi:hypothetical protein
MKNFTLHKNSMVTTSVTIVVVTITLIPILRTVPLLLHTQKINLYAILLSLALTSGELLQFYPYIFLFGFTTAHIIHYQHPSTQGLKIQKFLGNFLLSTTLSLLVIFDLLIIVIGAILMCAHIFGLGSITSNGGFH